MIIIFANNVKPILADVLILVVGTWPSADMILTKQDELYFVFLEGDYILISMLLNLWNTNKSNES